jgi:hypothetical protein
MWGGTVIFKEEKSLNIYTGMKETIEGKIYDTENAELITEMVSGLGKLYIYKTPDSWFVYSTGGMEWPFIETLQEHQVISLLFRYERTDILRKYFPNSVREA